ncbi:MAG TPA: hypothetical protein VIS94_00825 [Desulfomonilia bacterium]
MNKSVLIKKCPACDSLKIKKVRKDLQGNVGDVKYSVQALEYYECPDCKEKIYDINAMRRIEAVSPAFSKPAHHKTAAL